MENINFSEKNEPTKQIEMFKGNWTLLQKERNLSNKDVYIKMLEQLLSDLSNNKEENLASVPTEHFDISLKKYHKNEDIEAVKNILEDFDGFIDTVYAKTGYVESAQLHKQPDNLGVYSGGETYVFRDAVVKNETGEQKPISDNQKDIIDAHEKTHAVYEIIPNIIKEKIIEPFSGRIDGYKDKHQADEILARMAQIKNFLGFRSNEIFTKEHLDFVKKNYINETGLDNTMKSFIEKIENEELFIANMNNIPC